MFLGGIRENRPFAAGIVPAAASFKALAAAVFLAFGTLGVLHAAPLRADDAPAACADVPYDYAKDAQPTPDGNLGYASYAERAHRKECVKDWTVLVYMAADNDLTPYAFLNVATMEAAWSGGNFAGSTARTDLVLELSTLKGSSRKRIQVFQTDQQFRALTQGELEARTERDIRSPIIEQAPKNDGENEAQRLQDFLSWAAAHYPSKHYLVIVWGHGQGWAPRGSGSLNRWGGLAFDESDGSKLDIPSLRKALETMAAQIGHPVDVYASDACLMQMVEVATELSRSASYIVGSDTTQSYVGFPYRQIMYELNTGHFAGVQKPGEDAADPESEPLWVSRMFPQLYKTAMASPSGEGSELDPEAIHYLTSSALQSKALRERLVPSLEVLGQSVSKYIAEDPLRAIDLRYVARTSVEFEGDAQDLGIFLSQMRDSVRKDMAHTGGALTPAASELAQTLDTVANELDHSLVDYAVGDRYLAANPNGIPAGSVRAVSLWVPVSEADFSGRYKDFMSSTFYRYGFFWGIGHDGVPGWQSWLAKLYPQDASALARSDEADADAKTSDL